MRYTNAKNRLDSRAERMMCDDNVCDDCFKTEIFQYENDTSDEFITNLQHKKCKVIQLVRRQIHKFKDTQVRFVFYL